MSWRVAVAESMIYGVFPELDLVGPDVCLANDAAIFVMLFAKISAELGSARPYRSDPR
jgi:hypothetical protein